MDAVRTPTTRQRGTYVPPRMIAVDVDRTLVDTSDDDELHPLTVEAVSRLHADGACVVPVTGRPLPSALRIATRLGSPYVVALGGALVARVPSGIVAWSAPMPSGVVHEVWERHHGPDGTRIQAHTADGWDASHHDAVTRGYATRHGMRSPGAGPPTGDVLMMELVGVSSVPPMDGVTAVLTRSDHTDYVDVTAAGVDKASGADRVLSILGRTWADVWALGDGLNDLPLFTRAARSIAVGRTPPGALLAAATHHVPLSARQGCVGVALLGLAYGEPEHAAQVKGAA